MSVWHQVRQRAALWRQATPAQRIFHDLQAKYPEASIFMDRHGRITMDVPLPEISRWLRERPFEDWIR